MLACPAFRNKAANPYTSLLYEAMQRRGIKVGEFHPGRLLFESYDFLHFHWPEHHFLGASPLRTVLKAIRFFTVVLAARLKGMRIVWTAHNTQSHAHLTPRLEKVCWWLFYRCLAGIISLNRATQIELERTCAGRVPVAVIPHGHYRGVYSDTVSKLEARNHLAIPSANLVFGWIGQIKPYKGLPELASAWSAWPPPDVALMIAGAVDAVSLGRSLEEAAARDKRIRFYPGWVAADRMQFFLKAADVVVLPYRSITNSGAALLALSFNVPVALPRSPAMEELRETVGSQWVYLYEETLSAPVLQDIRRWAEEVPRQAIAPLEFLDWDRLAGETAAFLDQLGGQTRFGPPGRQSAPA